MQLEKTSIGKRIKRIRLSLGMTLQEFGEIFGATKGTVSKWEHDRYMPNPVRLNLIAFYGQISVDELLKGDLIKFDPKELFRGGDRDIRRCLIAELSDEDYDELFDDYEISYADVMRVIEKINIYVKLDELPEFIEVRRFEGDK